MLYSFELYKDRKETEEKKEAQQKLMLRDAYLLKKIKLSIDFKKNLVDAIEACKVLEISDKISFINYQNANLNNFKTFQFEDMLFFERIKDPEYLNKIVEITNDLPIEEDQINQTKNNKCEIILFNKK